MESLEYDGYAQKFAALTVDAGAIVMRVYGRDSLGARLKVDSSPVSDADEQAEEFLVAALKRLFPQHPIVAEESAARGETPAHGQTFLLVDPLDGTREFIARTNEFTVNIGLIENGIPRAGAIYAPALGQLWFGGQRAFTTMVPPGAPLPSRENWRELQTRPTPKTGMTALLSRSHLDADTSAFIARHRIDDSLQAGSSLKFCRVAEGVADVYPRFGPTMEWDTAAGDAVLRAAGGVTVAPGGGAFLYGKTDQNYRNGAFIAWGDPSLSKLS
jgi:3'(2'), 5'-bisphosphate nucleotidase